MIAISGFHCGDEARFGQCLPAFAPDCETAINKPVSAYLRAQVAVPGWAGEEELAEDFTLIAI
ncbi:hypothetical protein D3C87_2192820 [compost metagenome]